MGADIHVYAEYRNTANAWEAIPDYEPFGLRCYDVFSFFAKVRFSDDYRRVTPYPISEPRGLPKDVSTYVKKESDEWGEEGFRHSWLSVEELSSFDYNKPLRERKVHAFWAEHTLRFGVLPPSYSYAQIENPTIGNALGGYYFDELEKLKESKAERIVFWFDQ